MEEIESLAEQSLQIAVDRLTDLVFLQIENSEELMLTYNQLLDIHGAENVNARIGKYVRGRLDLSNIGRCDNPESNLIQSYERHGLGLVEL